MSRASGHLASTRRRLYAPGTAQLAAASLALLEGQELDSGESPLDWPAALTSVLSPLEAFSSTIHLPTAATTSVRSDLFLRLADLVSPNAPRISTNEAVRLLEVSLWRHTDTATAAVDITPLGGSLRWRSGDAVVVVAVQAPTGGETEPVSRSSGDAIRTASRRSTDRAAAVALLDRWLAEDAGEPGESVDELKSHLDRDRESSRKLFP